MTAGDRGFDPLKLGLVQPGFVAEEDRGLEWCVPMPLGKDKQCHFSRSRKHIFWRTHRTLDPKLWHAAGCSRGSSTMGDWYFDAVTPKLTTVSHSRHASEHG